MLAPKAFGDLFANALRTTRSTRALGGSASPLARRSLGGGGEDDVKSIAEGANIYSDIALRPLDSSE